MTRYFFDFREGEVFIPDKDGVELESVAAARGEAARALAEHAKDTVDDPIGYEQSVQVRTEEYRLFELKLVFEARRLVS